jgi:hypothetical protein
MHTLTRDRAEVSLSAVGPDTASSTLWWIFGRGCARRYGKRKKGVAEL